MAGLNVAPHRNAQQVAALLDLPEIERLIADLQETRWTGRPGYPIRHGRHGARQGCVFATDVEPHGQARRGP